MANKKEFVCSNCGYVGKPKKMTKGSMLMELVLWLLLLVPGIIYSIWRMTTRYEACPKCGNVNMIPTDTPKGQELLSKKS